MQKYAPWAPTHIAARHTTWSRNQSDIEFLTCKTTRADFSCTSHNKKIQSKKKKKKKSTHLLYTQAVECKAPVTVIKIEEWGKLRMRFDKNLSFITNCALKSDMRPDPSGFWISNRPLTGAVRINSLGNSRGVPSFFPQSQKTAVLFLFQKQAPG